MVGFGKNLKEGTMNYIAFDCHKRYTFARVEDASGRVLWEGRIPHDRGPRIETQARSRQKGEGDDGDDRQK